MTDYKKPAGAIWMTDKLDGVITVSGIGSQPQGSLRENRTVPDRRRNLCFPLVSCPRRRKSKGRRKNDIGGYVDVYDFRAWAFALSVLILSLLDAVLTGLQITYGHAVEANPIMNAAIARCGVIGFVCVKAAMTALPLAVIVLHKEWPIAKCAARVSLWSYASIGLYHLYLVQNSLPR